MCPSCPSAACYLSVTRMNVIHWEKALNIDSWTWRTWNNYRELLLRSEHPLTFWGGINKPCRAQSLTLGVISKAVVLCRVLCVGYMKMNPAQTDLNGWMHTYSIAAQLNGNTCSVLCKWLMEKLFSLLNQEKLYSANQDQILEKILKFRI